MRCESIYIPFIAVEVLNYCKLIMFKWHASNKFQETLMVCFVFLENTFGL